MNTTSEDIKTAPSKKVLYTAKVHTTGGRDGGASRSSDGRLDIKHSLPGGPGSGTNPEQLFAAGWSACFEGAMGLAARKMKVTLPPDMAIDAEVDLCLGDDGYSLQARLNVSLPRPRTLRRPGPHRRRPPNLPLLQATRGNIPRHHHPPLTPPLQHPACPNHPMGRPTPMKLTYYGHSCFSVVAAGKTLLFDPYVTPNELARAIDVDTIPRRLHLCFPRPFRSHHRHRPHRPKNRRQSPGKLGTLPMVQQTRPPKHPPHQSRRPVHL